MVDSVLYRHSLEVVYLTTAQDGGQYLMLLGSGQNEDDVCRGFLQRLQESIESCRREHVDLVDDKNLILAHLRRNASLLHQRLDVFHRVVGCCVELKDIQRALLIERLTTLALIAGLAIGRRILAVDGFGKDTCASGFSHASRSAEQIGMCQFATLHRILQCGGKSSLSHHRIERHGAVFSCRNNILHTIVISLRLQR